MPFLVLAVRKPHFENVPGENQGKQWFSMLRRLSRTLIVVSCSDSSVVRRYPEKPYMSAFVFFLSPFPFLIFFSILLHVALRVTYIFSSRVASTLR